MLSINMSIAQSYARLHRCPTNPAASGVVLNVASGEEKTQREEYKKASQYDASWVQDNIHLGYYPHIANKKAAELTFPEAGEAMTRRMIEIAEITKESRVLDLGCGKGLACKEIAELTGAACTGLDLVDANIQRGHNIAKENPHLNLDFLVGSVTDLPTELLERKYTHVFSQGALCHVHKDLPLSFSQLKKVLVPGGKAVVNDYVGTEDEVLDVTRETVHKQLHFEELCGHKTWRHAAEQAGLEILHYENLDRHMENSYRNLADAASPRGFKKNYLQMVGVCSQGQIGMNLAVLNLRGPMSRL